MVAANVHRSPARETGFVFRMTAEDREQLRAMAAQHGLSMQAYLERTVFGRHEPPRRSGPMQTRQQELPLS